MKLLGIMALLVAARVRAEPTAAAAENPLALHASLYATDLQPLNLELMGGTPMLHALLMVGTGRAKQFVAGTGLGAHFGGDLWMDIDATCSIIQALTGIQETDLLMQLRASIGVQILPKLAFFMGPSLSAEVTFLPNAMLHGSVLAPVVLLAPPEGGGGWQFWMGLQAGVRF